MKPTALHRLLAVALLLGAQTVHGQSYPSKPIRILVGFAAGGPTDLGARTIGQKLTEAWGQPVIVDIRAGASGNIAADLVAKSPPDGYTLLLAVFAHAVNPSLQKLPFDAVNDFAPIIQYASIANLLVVHPSIPARSVKELIAFARARPGELTAGSAGIGTSSHLSLVLMNSMTGTTVATHVPYKGLSAAHVDVVSGQISMLFDNVVSAIPHAKAGRIRMLAVTTLNRWPGAAEVPTMSEAGLAGYEVNSWYGLLAPAATPREIVQRLNAEVGRRLREADARARLFSIGAEPLSQPPETFAAFISAEVSKWAKIVKAAGIRIE